MDSREARQELAGLVDAQVAVAKGENRGRTYRLAEHLKGSTTTETTATAEPHFAASSAGPKSSSTQGSRQSDSRTNNKARISAELKPGPKTAAELAAATGLTARQVQYALQQLRDDNQVVLIGNPGQRHSKYELSH